MSDDTGIVFVLIPAGTFLMGSPEDEEGRNDDEMQHEVTISKPFYIGKYEVTQTQWEALAGNDRSASNAPATRQACTLAVPGILLRRTENAIPVSVGQVTR